jgi:hypothetical protein
MFVRSVATALLVASVSVTASAQTLGTFAWQLQPFCNVISVAVTGTAAVYTLEGTDDQCGGGTRAPVTGVATPNPDGSLGFGLHLVTSPGGHGVQVEARISLATLNGQWSDSDGNSGTFAFGQRTGWQPRPLPTVPTIPSAFGLKSDGGLVAAGTLDAGTIPASGAGTRIMWFPKRAAFRAGSTAGDFWDEPNVGKFSMAVGSSTVASGESSSALGAGVLASGIASLAAGNGTTASGHQSLATGFQSESRGNESVALGYRSIATGQAAVATGYETSATGPMSLAHGFRARALGAESLAIGGNSALQIGVSASGAQAVSIGVNNSAIGNGSVVIGTNATALAGAPGTFVYGDRSTSNQIIAFGPNEFHARASGGVFFYSNPTLSTGVRLAANASAWSTLSDANSKEHYADFDDETLLDRLAGLPVRTWSYKAQGPSVRHAGPTAQDFHDAFGLGEDPLRISTVDADGIALAAARALVLRQRVLEHDLLQLRERLLQLEAAMARPR